MKRTVIFVLLAIGVIVLPLLAESAADDRFNAAIQKLVGVFDSKAKNKTALHATLEVVSADGLPKEARDAKIDFVVSAPDHLRLGTIVDKERIEVGRIGQEIWVAEPGKNFALRGLPGVAPFAAEPKNLDKTVVGPLEIPVDADVLTLLPRLFKSEFGGTETIDGEVCREVIATPVAAAQNLLKLPDLVITLWVREKDALPARIIYHDGKSTHVDLALHDIRITPRGADGEWQLPKTEGLHVERVAISHLMKCFTAALSIMDSKTPTLGPATGARSLIAQHGAGRLEMHDETRVLFLKGTPEEMGEQHGKLLKKQVDDLISRVVYGVGVGSSFAKGHWFFGEIESCQARIGKFIDSRYTREMDALALASGHSVQEARLANFFPELFHCSGFALLGDATQGGHVYHGRVLDYMKGIGLERNAVVMVFQPDEGHAWVNVGYAGFVGSVTAMNDQHISIGEMGGRGEGNWDGKPMAQLLREVMEKAGTLDEAIDVMRKSPRTCEYYYVIADGNAHTAVGIKATPDTFEVVHTGEAHPQLDTPIKDTVLLSAGDRYKELTRRVNEGFGKFDADSARELMTRPVCMDSNIHSVLFAPDTLDFWVANSDGDKPASSTRYTKYNLAELIKSEPAPPAPPEN